MGNKNNKRKRGCTMAVLKKRKLNKEIFLGDAKHRQEYIKGESQVLICHEEANCKRK
jgi:hypothetical protein